MTTIAQYAAGHDMQPYESLNALDGGQVLAEEIAGYLTEHGFDYTTSSNRVTVGSWTAETTRGLPRPTAHITGPDGSSYETGDAERAAMLLALPIARTIWDMGRDDINIEYFDQSAGEVEVTVDGSTTIRTPYDEVGTVIITDHTLNISGVAMADLYAIFEAAELAYGDPLAAWQTLCGASDYESDTWEQIVEAIHDDARFCEGSRFTRVDSCRSESAALVEDWQDGGPTSVIDVESASDAAYWAPSDVAAAVLSIIA